MTQMLRCKVADFVSVLPVPPQTERRRGVLRFVGTTDFAPGLWAGIELFGAVGRNDGSVMGKSYFSCPAGQGVFVRLELVVPYTPEAEGHVGTPHETVTSMAVVEKLRTEMTRLHEKLQQRELALRKAEEGLRSVIALHDAKTAELQREREEKSQIVMAMTGKQYNAAATQTEEGGETDGEIHQLQQQCADLRDLCELQEEEINRQREHADDLAQIVEEVRREQEEERVRMEEKIRSLEEEVTHQQQVASELRQAAEESDKADMENMHLQVFEQQQEKEALRLLKERYEQLHAEREKERRAEEARRKQTTAEYEEALTQQREHKTRLLNQIQQLQQEIKDMRLSRERERVLQVPLSALEREEYESQLNRLRWELMENYGEMFAKRYDHFLAPVFNWKSPADVMGAMSEMILSSGGVLPFTTPEKCRHSRMKLFHMHPQR
ncbi:hypothetical protein TraAM80_05067 [Trypanosoma rangeli]|uniref:CAP-Gly domain-containing protein n=1 Tax=Trypanosoma rangeli TaxID=5698 RepID=A0A3R7L037_TRYRA|nr:uncharacterized protein TraAM80_05067 [Trypanosoma rangeli]RNF04866.1 hypothetical protein TraAM80_05067 [Trypanosoma rangeli]|eukprot:RNF04866.1 hypothetical protein TraAM80_05067 [Trypanosoma rangeli]